MDGRRVRLSALVAVGVLVSACSSGSSGGSTVSPPPTVSSPVSESSPVSGGGTVESVVGSSTTDVEQPEAGGGLVFLEGNGRPSVDPIAVRQLSGTNFDTRGPVAVFDRLIGLDNNLDVVPRLALSLTSDSSFVTWTLTLRPDVVFSDGTTLDAAAVKFNWDRHKDPAVPSACGGQAKQIEEMTVTSALVLTVTLTHTNAQFPLAVSDCLGLIGSPTAIQDEGDTFGQNPVGAGPFMLKEWVQDDHITLVKNPTYWDAPRPYLDQIEFRFIGDTQQRYQTFTTGGGDVFINLTLSPFLGMLQDDGHPTYITPQFGGTGYIMNTGRAPLNDPNVRQALKLALNLDEINEQGAQGAGKPIETFFPEDSPFYLPNGAGAPPQNDLAKAQTLIDDYVATHGPITLDYLWVTAGDTYAEALQAAWQKLDGVTVNLTPGTSASYQQATSTGDYDITISTLGGWNPYPEFTSKLRTGSTANISKYSNPQVDELLTQAEQTTDLNQLKTIYNQIAQTLYDNGPFIFIAQLGPVAGVYVTNDNTHNLQITQSAIIDFAQLWRN